MKNFYRFLKVIPIIGLICICNVVPQHSIPIEENIDYSTRQANIYQNAVGSENIGSFVTNDLISLYNTCVKSTVTVLNYNNTNSVQSFGSGVIYKTAMINEEKVYFIITNYHVVRGGSKYSILTYDNLIKDALLVGSDSIQDLALIMVTSYGISDDFIATTYSTNVAEIPTPQTGDPIFAIGNPSSPSLKGTLTVGIVSNGGRNTSADNTTLYEQSHAIQVDLALNPGNSGGPVFDQNGHLIGINTFKLTSVGNTNFEALNFALSIHDMLLGAERIRASASIGISGGNIVVNLSGTFFKPNYGANVFTSLINLNLADRATLKIPETIYSGVMIDTAGVSSSFKLAGIPTYAIIIEVDGYPITNLVDFRKVLIRATANQTLSVKYYNPNSSGYDSIPLTANVVTKAA